MLPCAPPTSDSLAASAPAPQLCGFARVHGEVALAGMLTMTASLLATALRCAFFALAGGVILAIMIVPYIAAVSREVLLAVPASQREAAMGLGATRWEVTKDHVLPYSTGQAWMMKLFSWMLTMPWLPACLPSMQTSAEVSSPASPPPAATASPR